MSHDVFISYAHDDRDVAERVLRRLEDAALSTWIAPRDIRPGANWGEAIVEGIEQSRAMVVVFSAASNDSVQVLREVERAVSSRVEIIPVRIEEVPLSKAMQYFISACHWLDATRPPLDQHLEVLTDVLRGVVGDEAAAAPSPDPPAASSSGSLLDLLEETLQQGADDERGRAAQRAQEAAARREAEVRRLEEELRAQIARRQFSAALGTVAEILNRKPEHREARELRTALLGRVVGQVARFKGHEGSVCGVGFTPCGQRLFSAGADGTLRLWDIETGLEIDRVQGHTEWSSAALAPDGQTAVTGAPDGGLCLWDLVRGKVVRDYEGHRGHVECVRFTPDGRRFVTGSGDKRVCLWRLEANWPERTLEGHTAGVESVALSADGHRLLSASQDGTVRLWDVDRGTELKCHRSHGAPVHAAAFWPSGSRAVSSGGDRSVRAWDLASGVEMWQVDTGRAGHSRVIYCLAVNAGGRYLACGGTDFAILVLDLATGTEVECFLGHNHLVQDMSFSGDGRFLVSASDDGTVRLWRLPE